MNGQEFELRDLSGNRTLVVFDNGDEVAVQAGETGIRFLLISGTPIKEPVAWHGPIVMNTQEELRAAFNELLKKFLGFIITKRRFFYVEKILNDFLNICSNSRGEIQAELSAAKDLNESEINNIKNELSNTFGSNIKLNHTYDPSLIGGLIIKVGSIMVDTSIKNKLQQIEKKMIEA